jgi:hypothetical protein
MQYSRGFTGTQAGANWRDALKALQQDKAHYFQNVSLMSPYERLSIETDLRERQGQLRPKVESGLITEWNASIQAFKQARNRVDLEKGREIVRWDAPKLRDNIQLFNLRVEAAVNDLDPINSIQALYQEAKDSGDAHLLRAAAEAVRAAPSKFKGAELEVRTKINGIVKDAERELAEIRTTPGLQQAHEQAEAAFDGMMSKQREMLETEQEIGGSHALYTAAAKVTIDRDTGKIGIQE